ncbi:MAG: hypothetical protein IPM82_14660 [Saprospiraceae bacterium]|nr:hypothetical protein [Saprospiraceae bacterium]
MSRWSQKTHGITFQVCLEDAVQQPGFLEIKYGESVTDTAFSNGYESLSGFGGSFKTTGLRQPEKAPTRKIVHHGHLAC